MDALTKFANDLLEDKLEAYMKSEPVPDNSANDVKVTWSSLTTVTVNLLYTQIGSIYGAIYESQLLVSLEIYESQLLVSLEIYESQLLVSLEIYESQLLVSLEIFVNTNCLQPLVAIKWTFTRNKGWQ